MAERKQVQELKGFSGQVAAAAFSADGTLLACAATDVLLFDAKTFKPAGTLKGPGQFFFQRLAFSPDGKMLAGTNDRTVYVWALTRGPDGTVTADPPRTQHHFGRLTDVIFAPDGKLLVAATDDGKLAFYDPQTLKRRLELAPPTLSGWPMLAVRPGANQLAAAGRNRILLFDLAKLELK